MTRLFEEIANLDRLIHDPSRLAILTALSACESADFTFLRNLTGMTAGNLSAHIAKLEDSKLVVQEKKFVNNRPNTLIKITELGFETINKHWDHLQSLRKDANRINLNEPEIP